jgi:hypothetical protein
MGHPIPEKMDAPSGIEASSFGIAVDRRRFQKDQIYLQHLGGPRGHPIYQPLSSAQTHKQCNSFDHFQLRDDRMADLLLAALLQESPNTIHRYLKILDLHQKLHPERDVFCGTLLGPDDI